MLEILLHLQAAALHLKNGPLDMSCILLVQLAPRMVYDKGEAW